MLYPVGYLPPKEMANNRKRAAIKITVPLTFSLIPEKGEANTFATSTLIKPAAAAAN
jgi:hypothetical protein